MIQFSYCPWKVRVPVGGGFCNWKVVALVMEILVSGYKVCCFTVSENLFAVIFLLLFFIPALEANSIWINYVLVGSTVVALPAIIFTKETYNRSNIDEAATTPDY